jgi:hypothetical protein
MYNKNHDVENLAVITKRKSTETIRPADRFPGDFTTKTKTGMQLNILAY